VTSLPNVVAEYSCVSPGVEHARAFFEILFFRSVPSRGAKCKKNLLL